MVPVQVHGVHLSAVIVDVHDHDLALIDHVHRHMRIEMSIDRPPEPRHPTDEARSAANGVVETAVCRRWVKGQRGRTPVAEQVEGGRRLRRKCWIAGPQDDGSAPGDLYAHGPAVARHRDPKISSTTRGDRYRSIGHISGAIDRITVGRKYADGHIGP